MAAGTAFLWFESFQLAPIHNTSRIQPNVRRPLGLCDEVPLKTPARGIPVVEVCRAASAASTHVAVTGNTATSNIVITIVNFRSIDSSDES